jgi:multidrug transporter EmrE-like cation transporter
VKWILLAVMVGATTGGDLLQSIGMRKHGEIHDFRPGALRRVAAVLARSCHIIPAIFLMAVSFFAFMSLLSVADLSFVVPVSAASFVLETILAKYVLREHVNWERWAGTGLVACGVALLAV